MTTYSGDPNGSAVLPGVGVPVLGRGRHRNMQRGACFMEYASYLAGEPWSDHPACTHPLLALIAREVNDETSSAGRPALAPLIPSVIGLTTDDPHLPPELVARCARLVLPAVSKQYQRVLAVALLTAEYALAELDGRPRDDVRLPSRQALHSSPAATRWATNYLASHPDHLGIAYAHRTAPLALAGAIRAITDFRIPSADALLHRLLVDSIEECSRYALDADESTRAADLIPALAT